MPEWLKKVEWARKVLPNYRQDKPTQDPEATSGEELLARLDNDGSTEESQPMTTVRADALPDLKEYTLIAFLDIEGAFNNVLPIAITESLTELGVESPMVGLIHKLLISRMVTATLRIQPRLD